MNQQISTLIPRFVAIALLNAFILYSRHAHAQILVGPEAGVQASWIAFHNKDNRALYQSIPMLGYNVGAGVSFRMINDVFLQSSILYSWKGKHLEGRLDEEFENRARFRYIEVPISFTKEIRMKLGGARSRYYYKVYLGAGPTMAYWVGGRGLLSSADLNENMVNPPSYKVRYHVTFSSGPEEVTLGKMNVEDANRLLLGLNFKVGLIFEPVGFNKFLIALRGDIGHSFFSQDKDGDYGLNGILYYEDDMQSRHNGLVLSVNYFIDLKTEEKNKGKSTIDISKTQKPIKPPKKRKRR